MQHPHPSSLRGFTLLEVMVAISLFTLMTFSVTTMVILAQRMGQSGRNRLEALQHARASLEELHSLSYSDPALDVGTHSISRGGYSGRYLVAEPLLNEMKAITLTYDYPSFGRTSRVQVEGRFSDALR